MSAFRGSDDTLDREIATVERLARLRLRRAASDLRELDSVLSDLRRERRRRQLVAATALPAEPVASEVA